MDILITDVTEMHAGNYCVAGWNASDGRMIRPLPGGSNWTGHLLAAFRLRLVGAPEAPCAPGLTLDRPMPQQCHLGKTLSQLRNANSTTSLRQNGGPGGLEPRANRL